MPTRHYRGGGLTSTAHERGAVHIKVELGAWHRRDLPLPILKATRMQRRQATLYISYVAMHRSQSTELRGSCVSHCFLVTTLNL